MDFKSMILGSTIPGTTVTNLLGRKGIYLKGTIKEKIKVQIVALYCTKTLTGTIFKTIVITENGRVIEGVSLSDLNLSTY